MSSRRNWNLLKEKDHLTEEQRRMYTMERLNNFRWISQLLASYSPVTLTSSDLVPTEVKTDIEEIGEFAELLYSSVPIELLLNHIDTLSASGFPLERYDALRDATLKDFFYGDVAKLPAGIFHRSSRNQIIVSISGTSQIQHIVQDLRFIKTKHPSGHGYIHSGFWALYNGLESKIKAGLRTAMASHTSAEIVITGHSMGGSVAYLLCVDLLSDEDYILTPSTIKLVTFGTPRVGDAEMVVHFQKLSATYKEKHGEGSFIEYSVRGYNDGVPSLPPSKLGYRHFTQAPIYAAGDQLYFAPASENECTLFRIDGNENDHPAVFPRGGHNYYNGRELEKMLRHIAWLDRANIPEGGWQDRYMTIVRKHSQRSVRCVSWGCQKSTSTHYIPG